MSRNNIEFHVNETNEKKIVANSLQLVDGRAWFVVFYTLMQADISLV